jgi:hypothetical protein
MPMIPVIPEKPLMLLDGEADPDAFPVVPAEDPVVPAEDPVFPAEDPVPVPVIRSELVWVRVTNGAGWPVESEVEDADASSSVVENDEPVASALEEPELEGDTVAVKDALSAVLFYIQDTTQLM